MHHIITYITGSLVVSCAISGCDAEPATKDQPRPEAQTETRPSSIEEARSIIVRYRDEYGELPPAGHGLSLITKWKEIRDRNGNHLRYTLIEGSLFEIRSAGPDAVFDTEDDLTDRESQVHRERVESRDRVKRQAELESEAALAAQESVVMAYVAESERIFELRLRPLRQGAAAEVERRRADKVYFRSDAYRNFVREQKEFHRKHPELGPFVPPDELVTYSQSADRLAEAEARGPQPVSFGDPGWDLGVGRIGYLKSARVIQIVNDSSLLVSTAGKTVIVKGLGTANLVDGDVLYPYIMKVIGRTSYTTVLGAKATVLLLEPFDIAPFRRMIPPSALRD